jgi:hypothetical protein
LAPATLLLPLSGKLLHAPQRRGEPDYRRQLGLRCMRRFQLKGQVVIAVAEMFVLQAQGGD